MSKSEYEIMVTVNDMKNVLEKSTAHHTNTNMRSMEVDSSIFSILSKKVQEYEKLANK